MLAFSFGAVRGTVEFWRRCRRRAGDMDNYSDLANRVGGFGGFGFQDSLKPTAARRTI